MFCVQLSVLTLFETFDYDYTVLSSGFCSTCFKINIYLYVLGLPSMYGLKYLCMYIDVMCVQTYMHRILIRETSYMNIELGESIVLTASNFKTF